MHTEFIVSAQNLTGFPCGLILEAAFASQSYMVAEAPLKTCQVWFGDNQCTRN